MWGEMVSKIPEEHMRDCMLLSFTRVVTQQLRMCQRWFSKFRRLTTLENDMLREKVGANPCQKIEELSKIP